MLISVHPGSHLCGLFVPVKVMRVAVMSPTGPPILGLLSKWRCAAQVFRPGTAIPVAESGVLLGLPELSRRFSKEEEVFRCTRSTFPCQLMLFLLFLKAFFFTLFLFPSLLYIFARSWPLIWKVVHSQDNRRAAGVGSDSVIFIFTFHCFVLFFAPYTVFFFSHFTVDLLE